MKSLALTKSGRIISGTRDGSAMIRNVASAFDLEDRLVGHNDQLVTMSLLEKHDKKLLVTGSWDGFCNLYDLAKYC